MNRFFRSGLLPLILIVLVVYLASSQFMGGGKNEKKVTLSQFQTQVQGGQVESAVFNPPKQSISYKLTDETKGTVHYPSEQSVPGLQRLLNENHVEYDSKGVGTSAWWSILTGLLPFVLLFGFWIFLMNQVQGGGSKVMSFGKSRAKRMTPDSPKIGFKDVAGVDEAVEELQEIKEFLENPKKFQALGARIPKGVLLYGPPGTG
jgi:cell division protease FtsH